MRLFEKICEPVAFAHSRGVLHRDLKPPNVMVGPFGEVLVMDWGVAKIVSGAAVSEEVSDRAAGAAPAAPASGCEIASAARGYGARVGAWHSGIHGAGAGAR